MPEQYKFSSLREKTGEGASKTIYQNKQINFPFDLKKMDFFVDPEGDAALETHPHHHRAAWFPKVAMGDKEGNVFFDTTIKGLGYLYPESYRSKKDDFHGESGSDITVQKSVEDPWGYKVLGLFDRRNLGPLLQNIEKLKKAGLRCEEVAAANELKKVLIAGQPKDIKELREYLISEAKKQNLSQKILDDIKGFEPVLLVRIMRENWRIADFCDATKGEKRKMLADVFKALNIEKTQEKENDFYDIDNPESMKKYLEDFFTGSGKNLAIMQNNGAMMTYFNSGNITLSLGEVVDLDSIIFLDKGFSAHITPDAETEVPKGYKKDIRDQIYALGKMFIEAFGDMVEIDKNLRERLTVVFQESYDKNIDKEKLKKLKVNPEKVMQVVSDYSKEMIKFNRRVAPVKLM
jgi:hypothetical protein